MAVHFPNTLSNYNVKIACATSEEMIEVVKTMAQKTATLYAKLLTSEGHAERSPSLRFNGYPSVFLSAGEVDLFKNQLAENISEQLLPLKKSEIRLQTHFIPEGLLADILNKCNITAVNYPGNFHKYFPYNTYATIRLDTQLKVFKINIEYLPASA